MVAEAPHLLHAVAYVPSRRYRPAPYRPDPVRQRAKDRRRRIRSVHGRAPRRAGRPRHSQSGPRPARASSGRALVARQPRPDNRRFFGCRRHAARQLPFRQHTNRCVRILHRPLQHYTYRASISGRRRPMPRVFPLALPRRSHPSTGCFDSALDTDAAIEQGDVHAFLTPDALAIRRRALGVRHGPRAKRRRGERQCRRDSGTEWPCERRPGYDLQGRGISAIIDPGVQAPRAAKPSNKGAGRRIAA